MQGWSCGSPDVLDCAKTDAERRLLLTTFYGLSIEAQSLQMIARLKDVNIANADGSGTVLSVAINLGRKKAVAALRKKEADPLATDRLGNLLINNLINQKLSAAPALGPDVLACLRLALEHAARRSLTRAPTPCWPRTSRACWRCSMTRLGRSAKTWRRRCWRATKSSTRWTAARCRWPRSAARASWCRCCWPAGADPNATDERGVTAMAAAQRRRDQSMIGLLAAAGAQPGAAPVQPRLVLPTGSAFAQEAARTIDAVALFDPPRFGINNVREGLPFAFYGQSVNQMQEVRCERSAHFGIVAFANEAAGILAGVCEREARSVRDLAADSARAIDALFGQLAQGGGMDRAKLAQQGWAYLRSAAPDGAEVHYFPVIMVGHCLGVATTVVVIAPGAQAAVVVQADTARLCQMPGLATQTPLCSDTRKALTDMALSLQARIGGDALRAGLPRN